MCVFVCLRGLRWFFAMFACAQGHAKLRGNFDVKYYIALSLLFFSCNGLFRAIST
jgi:hypothetical protein